MNEPVALVPQALPSVSFHDRYTLPVCSAVYFAMTVDGTILYIGKSVNLCERWKQHHRIQRLQDMDCATIAWHACPPEEINALEWFLIRHFQPPLNGQRSPAPSPRAKRAMATKRYVAVLPEGLFLELQALADERGVSVLELLRQFIRLGLFVAKVEATPGAMVVVREDGQERQLVLL